MKLFVSLAIICVTLSAVYGLKCYTCWGTNPGHCNDIWECPAHFDRCSSTIVSENLINKQCMRSDMCNMDSMTGIRCCSGDLCNGAKHTGVFLPVLLAPLVIITLYIWNLMSPFFNILFCKNGYLLWFFKFSNVDKAKGWSKNMRGCVNLWNKFVTKAAEIYKPCGLLEDISICTV